MRILVVLLLIGLACAPARAMSYRFVPLDDGRCGGSCRFVIEASGEIEHGEIERFVRFLAAARGRRNLQRILVIGSPGGSVRAGLLLGFAARRLNLTMVVAQVSGGSIRPAVCASACVLALMGGARRLVPDGSVVAVHRPSTEEEASFFSRGAPTALTRETADAVTRLFNRYAAVMGIDPKLVALIMSVPHTSGRILTPAELRRYRLVTSAGPL